MFDGPRNFKRNFNAADIYEEDIAADIQGRVYGNCMTRRNALSRMKQFLLVQNPTLLQQAAYNNDCRTALRTVTRETELVCIAACR